MGGQEVWSWNLKGRIRLLLSPSQTASQLLTNEMCELPMPFEGAGQGLVANPRLRVVRAMGSLIHPVHPAHPVILSNLGPSSSNSN